MPRSEEEIERAVTALLERKRHEAEAKAAIDAKIVQMKLDRVPVVNIATEVGLTQKQVERRIDALRKSGSLPSMPIHSRIIQDLVGQSFGRLTVIERGPPLVRPDGDLVHTWLCQCACGVEELKFAVIQHHNLLRGETKSCGCIRAEIVPKTDTERYEVRKMLRQKRADAGLCFICGRQAEPGIQRCASCRTRDLTRNNKRTQGRRDAGLCPACPEPPKPSKVGTLCREHWGAFRACSITGSSSNGAELLAKKDANGGLCVYTGTPIPDGFEASNDHTIPLAHGGSRELSNIEWVRYDISLMKSDTNGSEFVGMCRLVCEIVDHHATSRSYRNANSDPLVAMPPRERQEWLARSARRATDDATAEDMLAMWQAQKGRCAYSGIVLVPKVNVEVDHKISFASGGTKTLDNIHFVCSALNRIKLGKTHGEFVATCREVVAFRNPAEADVQAAIVFAENSVGQWVASGKETTGRRRWVGSKKRNA